jgi:outer membrane protein TolC
LYSLPPERGRSWVKAKLFADYIQMRAKANLDQANALLELRRFDLETTEALVEKGFKSEIQLKSQKAQVDVASAK